jgi:protocatechuate 3,4-dioxygenase beta subunit
MPVHEPDDNFDFCGTDEDPRFSRRQIVGAFGFVGLVTIGGGLTSAAVAAARPSKKKKQPKGKGPGPRPAPGPAKTGTTVAAAGTDSCAIVPEETGGPFPADGSNGINVLTQAGIIRSDIRSSFGASTASAPGLPVRLEITVIDHAKSCAPINGAAVYVWHCDANGGYSMYSQGLANENYLRGVQPTGATGTATFTTMFPGAYPGRWPHIHFEIYPSVEKATTSRNRLITSQLALPDDGCKTIYATKGYEASRRNFVPGALLQDNVFSDGVDHQLATVTGNATDGFVIKLAITI